MQAKATGSNVINQPFASRSSDGWRSQTLTRGGRKIGEVAGGHETTAPAMPRPLTVAKKGRRRFAAPIGNVARRRMFACCNPRISCKRGRADGPALHAAKQRLKRPSRANRRPTGNLPPAMHSCTRTPGRNGARAGPRPPSRRWQLSGSALSWRGQSNSSPSFSS